MMQPRLCLIESSHQPSAISSSYNITLGVIEMVWRVKCLHTKFVLPGFISVTKSEALTYNHSTGVYWWFAIDSIYVRENERNCSVVFAHCYSFLYSVSQSNRSTNQSVSQSINQSINRSIDQSINQPTNQSINQLVSQSVILLFIT